MALKFSHYTAKCAEEGDAPRSRRELNALLALGGILNKPNWWTKWTNEDIRDRWLSEITTGLVAANVRQVAQSWPELSHWQRPKMYQPYLELASYTGADKQTKIEEVLAHVLYPPAKSNFDAFEEGTSYESDTEGPYADDEADGDEDSDETTANEYAASAIETNFKTVYNDHKNRNAFGQIAWYVHMSGLQEQLRRLPLEEWTERAIGAVIGDRDALQSNASGLAIAQALILQAARAPSCSVEFVRSLFPNESRDNVIKLLHLHLRHTRAFLEETKRDITRIIELSIKKLRLTPGAVPLVNGSAHPGPVPRTWISDSLIDAALKATFVSQLQRLENVPDAQKDWHPNSDDQVLNLVHPSLFCGVKGVTKMLDTHEILERLPPSATAAEHMRSIMFAPAKTTLDPKRTKFQWLPCEVDVGQNNEARIRTYINNLHPEDHADLYDTIGSIFSKFVPLFDQVLSTLDTMRGKDDYFFCDRGDAAAKQRVEQALKTEYPDATSSLRRLVPQGLFGIDPPRYSLQGTRCQVIVKIAQIILTPEKPSYPGGSWHVEGTDAERIIATGLYYYGCENITESRLSFRMFVVGPEDYEQSDYAGVALTYGLKDEQLLTQHFGSVTAMEDRCVVFPNLYQHKVEPFQLADPTKPGVRKILAFFLVDPTNGKVPSTAVVPPQQQKWIDRAHPPMQQLGLPDVVTQQIKELTRDDMTLDAAKATRLQLMAERSPINYEDDEENVFSLCEH